MDQTLEPLSLREYLGVLKARKWTILVTTAAIVGAVLSFSFQQTPLYQASARMLVRSVPTDSSGFLQIPNLETESEIVRSEPVASLVLRDLELGEAPTTLLAQLQVQPASQSSQVLTLTYTSPDAQLARDVTNSFANNYIEYKRAQAREALEIGADSIQSRVESVQTRLTEVTERIGSPEIRRDPALLSTLETERSALVARLGVLQQRLDDFQAGQPIDLAGGQIIDPAGLASSPSSPDHARNGLLALIVGLAFGVGLAFLKERLDDRFKGREDAARSVGAPVLAAVPRMKLSKRKGPYILATSADPRGHMSEAYRSLRTGIEFIGTHEEMKSVLITSPSPGEGKTVTSANLAVALAQAGRRVILVSADLRRPTLEKYFGLDVVDRGGLSDWLTSADRLRLDQVIIDPGVPNMRVVPSGRVPSNPAEILASPRLVELITILEDNSDTVLFDSPPVVPVADALILSSRVRGTILVLDSEKTHRSAAIHAKDELRRVGANIIGAVLNSFDPSSSPYYYYESYSYGHNPQDATINGAGSEAASHRKDRSAFGFRR